MCVILRMKNMPLTVTAADIRQYFHGITIPKGGVRIVGGERADVFIIFSTSEDARKAMAMDGGFIHNSPIKLMLSSHSEMGIFVYDEITQK